MNDYPFPDKDLALAELRRDVLFERIPREDRSMIIDTSWKIGEEEARKLIMQYDGQIDIYEIAVNTGLKILREEKEKISANLRYFSELICKRKANTYLVILYTVSIEKWAVSNNISYERSEELIIYHEYFHYLEQVKLGDISTRYRVPIIKFGKVILYEAGIHSMSEIAAHGFTHTLYQHKKDDETLISK